MDKKVIVTGADRGLGLALVQEFLQDGDTVFAGQYMEQWGELSELKEKYPQNLFIVQLDVADKDSVETAYKFISEKTNRIDYLVNNAGISGGGSDIYNLENPEKGVVLYNVNVMGPLRMVNTFLPLLENSKSTKRLCFVSSECGSISVCHREEGFLYPMTKAALNMTVKMLFSQLYSKGYTFRLFHPGWVRSYMSGQKSTMGKFEPEESAASGYAFFTESQLCEDILRVVDNEGNVWPF